MFGSVCAVAGVPPGPNHCCWTPAGVFFLLSVFGIIAVIWQILGAVRRTNMGMGIMGTHGGGDGFK